MQNPFADLIPQNQQRPLPQVIEGPPREPTPQTPAQAQKDVLDVRRADLGAQIDTLQLQGQELVNRQREMDLEAARAKAAKDAANVRDLETAKTEMINVINAAKRAKGMSRDGWFTTGIGSSVIGSQTPSGADIRGLLDTIGSNVAFDRLSRMRAESPTGGALGSITERELQLLQSTVASLDPGQSDVQFQGNMDTIVDRYTTLLRKLGGVVPLNDDEFNDELLRLLRKGDREGIALLLKEQNKGIPDEGQLEAALLAGTANINHIDGDPDPSGQPPSPPSGGSPDHLATSHPGLFGFGVGLGDVVEGAGDILGLVANPVNTTINTVFGTELPTDAGQTLRNFTGLPEPVDDRQRVVSAINKGGVSALGLGGLARTGANLTTGAVRSGLERFGAMPAQDVIAGGTGGASAEVARQNGAGPVGQVVAGLAGGLATVPVTGGINALLPSRAAAPVENALARAGREEGVNVTRAMADPRLQNRVTGVEATMIGGPVVRGAMNQVRDQIQGRANALGQGGQALETNVAGQKIIGASERYIKTSGKAAGRAYDAAEKAAGDARITPTSSRQLIDDAIERLSETANTNASEISFLKGLKSDLSKDLSVGALRDMRTTLRQKISKGELTFGQNEARVLAIMDSAADDIAAGLRAQGRGKAATLFERADRSYRERMQFISGTIQKLIGKRGSNISPERVFSNLRGMASPKGDEAGLARMLHAMDPEERADIAATFAESLGKNAKGEFSTAWLVRHVNALPKAARVNLFGAKGEESVQNLVRLAKEHDRVMSGLNNSRTGVANDWRSWMGSVVFGGGTGIATTSPTTGTAVALGTAGVKAGRDFLSARSLMNTDVARWINSVPRSGSVGAMRRHASQLAPIAAKNPAIAGEINQLQQLVARAMNDNSIAAGGRSVAAGRDGSDKENER